MHGATSILVLPLVLLWSSSGQPLTTQVISTNDEMSDSTLVTCMAYEFETMEWQITAESSDFEQNIDPDTVQRSASDAEEVAQGITLRSDFTTSFTSPQQNSGSSTLTISSSFPLEGFFTFSCTAIRSSSSNGGISSSIQSWSVTIFIGDSDVTSENPPNESNDANNNVIVIIISVVVSILLLITLYLAVSLSGQDVIV